MADVDVDTSGPVFSPGVVHRVMEAGARGVENEVAEEGVELIRRNLDGVLRRQTGRYRSSVQASGNEINDGGIVYGPWLEGLGSRNRTTRFKGYFTFRRTTQQIEDASGGIGERALAPYVGRLD